MFLQSFAQSCRRNEQNAMTVLKNVEEAWLHDSLRNVHAEHEARPRRVPAAFALRVSKVTVHGWGAGACRQPAGGSCVRSCGPTTCAADGIV